MSCVCRLIICVAVLASSLIVAPRSLIAQNARTKKHWLSTGVSEDISRGAVTKPGGPIVSYPCDPMMSAKRESELLEALRRESEFGWGPGTPLTEMAADLSKHFPVLLDRRSLEEIGIDEDAEIASGPLVDGRSLLPSQDGEKTRWWKEGSSHRPSGRRPSLILDVTRRLHDLELTLMIRHGQVVITTIEAAEDDLATRIYDVTPLLNQVQFNSFGPRVSSYEQDATHADYDSLMDIIHTTIDADTWEVLGGNSTIVPSPIRGRHWLVISTTSMTHLKIQALLDRLNQ